MSMRLDAFFGTFELSRIGAEARAAEALGFDGFFVGENTHDPFIGLALAAAQTSRIELGTSVALALVRTPTSLAYTARDLQELSDGRFHLGLGTQVKAHLERRFGVPWDRPLGRLADAVHAMRACWRAWETGEPLNYQGTFFQLTLMPPYFRPAPLGERFARIPVYFAGLGDAMARLSGRIADGMHIHPLHTRRYLAERVIPEIEKGLLRGGRTRGDITLSAQVFVATGRNRDEWQQQVERVKDHIAFYASTPNYAPVLELHGWQELGHRLRALIREGRWDILKDEISDDMVEAMAVVAEPERLGQAVRDRYEGILDRVSCYDLPWPLEAEEPWRRLIAEFKS